jgi:hypothetical protein
MKIDGNDGEVLKINSKGRTGDILSAIIGGLAWIVIGVVLFVNHGYVEKNGGPLIAAYVLCAFGVAANVGAFIRQSYGKRVTFDKKTRTIEIIRLFGKKTVMTFDSVGRVAPLTYKTTFTTREAYCLVPTIAPIFGVKIISPLFRSGGREIENFRSQTVPKVENILELEKTSSNKQDDTPAVPRRYAREGMRYTKFFARWQAPVCIFLILFILPAAAGISFAIKNHLTFVIAALCATAAPVLILFLVIMFAPIKSITFDAQRKNIEVKRGAFGWGGIKSHGFSSVKSINVQGAYGEGSHRTLYLKLDGIRSRIPVVPFAARGRDVTDELKFLACLLGLDPVNDIVYTVYQLADNMFEVP